MTRDAMDSSSLYQPGMPPAGGGTPLAPEPAYPAPWGYLGTIGWALAALIAGAIVSAAGGLWWFGFDGLTKMLKSSSDQYNGAFISLTQIISAPVQIGVLAMATRLKHWPVGPYIGFVVPRRQEVIRAVILLAAILFVLESATSLLGHDVVSEFQKEAYRTSKATGWLPELLLAIVVLAPIVEEITFRGFFYRGFVRKPGLEPVAIVVISLAWTMLHIQYDWQDLLQIFIIGIALGWVRWSSGSTLLTMFLHALLNLWAMIETVVRMEWMPR